jgi:hypothetical protein
MPRIVGYEYPAPPTPDSENEVNDGKSRNSSGMSCP